MSINRNDVVTHVRTLADAKNATVDYPPEFVLLVAERVFDREWAGLLDAVPFYRVQKRTYTATSADAATGGIALTALDSGTGATKQRTYKVLQAERNADRLRYRPPEQFDFMAGALEDRGAFTCSGDTLYVPGLAAGDVITAAVNWRPQLIRSLKDTDVVDYAEGAYLIPMCETAALMLGKGGRQPGEADTLVAMAEGERQQLYATLGAPVGGVRQLVNGGTVVLDPRDVGGELADWSGEGF